MTSASLLLILVAVALLVAGVVGSTNALIVCSIAATVLAAILLVIGVRQDPPLEPDTDPDLTGSSRAGEPPVTPLDAPSARFADQRRDARATTYGAATTVDDPVGRGGIPSQAGTAGREARFPDGGAATRGAGAHAADTVPQAEQVPAAAVGYDDDIEPQDEPPAQHVPDEVAAEVRQLESEVFVVDGRPRYHLDTCGHLSDKESEPISVAEAVELGFTPCSVCRPDDALLADLKQG